MTRGAEQPVTVAVFHSVFGLRAVERAAAERLRAAGHPVILPDLFDGAVAGDGRAPGLDEGFALLRTVGWEVIAGRARDALAGAPRDTALLGLSMGAGVVGSVWPARPGAAAIVLLHAPAPVPESARPGTPIQVHVGGDDSAFAPPDQLAAVRESASRAATTAEIHTYPGLGHFFTDPELPEYDARAATLAWSRVLALLAGL